MGGRTALAPNNGALLTLPVGAVEAPHWCLVFQKKPIFRASGDTTAQGCKRKRSKLDQ